ncbi:hypothetical protein BGZ82_009240 [Podila clonocystis]|nr:hypothetical protein BGZ82_009240 [Podila clonocystis]
MVRMPLVHGQGPASEPPTSDPPMSVPPTIGPPTSNPAPPTSEPPTSIPVITDPITARPTTKETAGVRTPTSRVSLLPNTSSGSSAASGPPVTSTSKQGVPYGPSNSPSSGGSILPSGVSTNSQSSNMGAILGGVAGILIVVLATGFFVLRRRRSQNRLTKEHVTFEEKAPPRDPEFLGDELAGHRNKLGSSPQVPYEDDSRVKTLVSSPEEAARASIPGSPQDHKYVPSPQTSLSSTIRGDSPYVAGYSPYTVNGPHKIIAGSRASSVLHGREGAKFLRDTELYHDDARSWMSKRSRIPRDNNANSGAYVAPMTFQSYNEDEEEGGEEYQIPLEEQVAFVRSQQQDLDRLRQEQQEWLERMEKILENGNPPVVLDGSVVEVMSSTGSEEGTDASTVAGDSGTVTVVVPPEFEGTLEVATQKS